MQREASILIFALVVTLAVGLAACVTSQSEPAGAAVTTRTDLTPTPMPTSTPSSYGSDGNGSDGIASNETNYFPITLPVLDAFFVDETFRAELRDRVGLSDEQIGRLRAVSRVETLSLRESADGQSATTALTRAREQITAVTGEEKADRLYALAREWWSGGGARSSNEAEKPAPGVTTVAATTLGAPLPNAVPSDSRIVVNAPAYRMDLFDSGKLVKSYRIGIGYPEFPLPAGIRAVKMIIFNPTWTPPDEPWVESPSSKVKVGQLVAAGNELNPLGLVKIPIGSPSLIHGGKSPVQLGGFASHGCVGLTNAQVIDLSKRLAELGGVEITDNQIAKYRRNRTQSKNIALLQPIPVELRYETIVVEDGELRIYRDVYERGTNTEESLRNVLGAYGVTLESLSENERSQVMDALDQMGRNAGGKVVPHASPTPFVDYAAGPTPGAMEPKRPKGNSLSRRVTRQVKGAKEVMIKIAALSGKGYSAPVQLNTGK